MNDYSQATFQIKLGFLKKNLQKNPDFHRNKFETNQSYLNVIFSNMKLTSKQTGHVSSFSTSSGSPVAVAISSWKEELRVELYIN